MSKYRYSIAEPDIGEDELLAVTAAIKSNWISGIGPFVREFERKFAQWIGVKYGVATANGTVALHLALAALGVGPGDEVLVPDLTFAATINAVLYAGAKPVIVDVHPDYWCINPDLVRKFITPRTKAMIVVHLYGHPCDMKPILEVAEEYGIYLIEDAAEAHGAEYLGRKVGTFGHVSCFSFYANKIITTGEGGMCLTNDEELAEKMRVLRDHGMRPEKRYWHEVVGYNYRMTNLQAAIGLAQLKKIERYIERKRRIAKVYSEELSDIPGLTLHPEMPWAKCVYWLYSIVVNEGKTGISRDHLAQELEKRGIEIRRFFYPLHEMPPYRRFGVGRYYISTKLSSKGLNLPSGVRLTDEDIVNIVSNIRRIIQSKIGGLMT